MEAKQKCCEEVNGFYLGTTCPICKKQFRQLKTMNKADNLPMSAEEWHYKGNNYGLDEFQQDETYAKYFLSHHINVLAERIKNGATYTHYLKNATPNDRDGFHFVITQDNIEKIAKDYINEIQKQ